MCVRLILHIDAGFIFQKIRGTMILEQNKGAKNKVYSALQTDGVDINMLFLQSPFAIKSFDPTCMHPHMCVAVCISMRVSQLC